MLNEFYCDSAMNTESSLIHYHSNARKNITKVYWDFHWSIFPNN